MWDCTEKGWVEGVFFLPPASAWFFQRNVFDLEGLHREDGADGFVGCVEHFVGCGIIKMRNRKFERDQYA